jgi:predicted ATP-grasp superfamily ATP-dependent carboligase
MIKPVSGAGSQDVRRAEEHEAAALLDGSQESCVQQFCPGRPASVAAICGARQQLLLPPCWQHLDDHSFAYRGGSRILAAHLVQRAQLLAGQAVRSLPRTVGYLGFDIVLGPAEDGSTDYVIEINPRLTSSYLGLRLMTKQNLAAAFLDVVAGTEIALLFGEGPLEFQADGRVCKSDVSAVLPANER